LPNFWHLILQLWQVISAFRFFSEGRIMKPSGKERLCGLREDETPGAVSAVSGVFLSVHTSTIQQGSLFCQEKNEGLCKIFSPLEKGASLWW
jgi:hypothetical protein